jgi:hypothetical protein
VSLLELISETSVIRWVAESDWGYPIVLTSHAIGMALVVGIQLMLDLRVLGVGSRMPLAAMRPYFRVAWLGLVVNVVSGTLLFFVNYSAFLGNPAFLTKLAFLFLAAVVTWILVRSLSSEANAQFGRARVLAGLCLVLWVGAITAGRLVAYTSVSEVLP